MAPDQFWQWQLTIGGLATVAALDAIVADLVRLPASAERRDLLALCDLQRAVVTRPAPPAAEDHTLDRDWTTTEFRALLDGRGESTRAWPAR
jgi:hypothetical protein